ncbi:MAG: tyrosine-type recombinase/integrase [Candidatus Bathyarchaeia archaeon]
MPTCTHVRDCWERLDSETKGRILSVLADLEQKRKLKQKTIRVYRDALVKLASEVRDLNNQSEVTRYVASIRSKTLATNTIAAYNHFSRVWKIPSIEFNFPRDRRRPLPILPPENTLQASLVIPESPKWKAYFRLLYETGARPSEPFAMTVGNVNFEKQLVRLGTAKGSGDTLERELPISPLLTEMLRTLSRNKPPEAWLFSKTTKPDEPLTYHQAERLKAIIKKQLRASGYNVAGFRLHGYRHAFATRLYHATKDLALVSRSLGHRSLETTMIYIHLRPDQPRRYDVVHYELHDKEGIAQKIAEGWEIALQTTEEVWFRRPRWVP